MMKRILFLGGPSQALKVIKTAKEMGIYAIVTDRNACDSVRKIADEILPFSVSDVSSLIDWCKNNPVDGILNFCVDAAQKTHFLLCKEFGFPFFGDIKQIEQLSDKRVFKDLCIKNGIDVIPSFEEKDIDNFFNGYPLLVKPDQSSGSRGSTICYSYEEYVSALRLAYKETTNGKITIEKYMEGKQDFAFEYLFINGKPYLIKTSDRYLGNKNDCLQRQAVAIVSPSKSTNLYIGKIESKIVSMLNSIGIKNGALFVQGLIDGDTIRFYDPAYRFPGTEYENSLLKATGFDCMKYAVNYSLGKDVSNYAQGFDKMYFLNSKIAVSLMIAVRPGTICSYEGFDLVSKLPHVVTVSIKKRIGSVIPNSGSVEQRFAEIAILEDRNVEKIANDIREIYSMISVKDELGDEMIVSRFEEPRLSNVL